MPLEETTLIDFTTTRGERVPLAPDVTDITEQLTAEFGAGLDRSSISRVVLRSLHDLQCSPAAARVVGLERLTRERLRALAGEHES